MDPATVDYTAVDGSTFVAVLVHPHPNIGGNRFNHVIDSLYQALPRAGVSAARFDLTSADPPQARADTLTVMDLVGTDAVALIGYSFGAAVALGVDDPRVAGWFAVALPLRMGDFSVVAVDPRPKTLLVPEYDQFSPPAQVRDLVAAWVNTTVTILAGADHFMVGHSRFVVDAVSAWAQDLSP
jgi:alpha/beta superfamily hydrolase